MRLLRFVNVRGRRTGWSLLGALPSSETSLSNVTNAMDI